MVFEQVYNNYAREAKLVDDAMFLKESLHGVKRKPGGDGGGATAPPPPPFAHTTSLSRVLKGAI